MNPDDIAIETIMPGAFLDLAREMVAQESPEAAATAALAWALRHAPVDGGSLEISGHRIERIAPEPDPWPTDELIVATRKGMHLTTVRRIWGRIDDVSGFYRSATGQHEARPDDTLTNVVPVTVVPAAALPVLWSALEQWLNGPRDALDNDMRRLAGAVVGLREQIDALGVDL